MARTFKGMNSVRKNAEEAASMLSSERIQEIPSSKIKDSPLNEGLPMRDLDSLAASLKETGGPVAPIIVYDLGDGTYELVSGHRRRQAWCRLLKHKTIKCRVREYPSDPYVRFREHAAANTETREKDPLFWLPEIRHARELLSETGFSGSEAEAKQKIYDLLGKGASPQQIARYEGFSKLTPEMQSLAELGLSVPTLYNAVRLSEEEQRELAAQISEHYRQFPESELSRNDFIRMVAALKNRRENTSGAVPEKKTYSDRISACSKSLLKSLSSAKTGEDRQAAIEMITLLEEELKQLKEKYS